MLDDEYDDRIPEVQAYIAFARQPRFTNLRDARTTYRRAEQGIAFMHSTLSGCDWCCGGGREALADASSDMDTASKYLLTFGEDITTKPSCTTCGYADGQHQEGTHDAQCIKCLSYS
tara:strand:- start:5086 stop:5436 length:351 start_codon:yes stop_codon:yes gene_type:complete